MSTTAHDVAQALRRLRGKVQVSPELGDGYAGYATGHDLAPPIDAEGQLGYLQIALEILAMGHAGADPVHDLDPLLAVSLLKAVVGSL